MIQISVTISIFNALIAFMIGLINSVLLMTAHVAMVHIDAAPIALVQSLNPLLTALLASSYFSQHYR